MTLYTEIRKVTELDYQDIAQVMYDIGHGSNDFTVEDYRFIHQCDIDSIMYDELKAEPYILGCFNSDFLAEVLEVSVTIIDTLQENSLFEEIGNMIIEQGKLEGFVTSYVNNDGYSAHFAECDCADQMIRDYYMFKL